MDARWYLAQTLDERLRSFRESKRSSNGTDADIAAKRLERWKSGTAFHRDSDFQRFLKNIDLSENEFKEILGQSKEQIQELTGEPLAWVNEVLDCLDTAVDVKSSTDFLALIDPQIAHFRNKLQSYASTAQSQSPQAFHPDKLVNLLCEEIATRLRKTIEKILILETNIARIQDRLSGESKAERYASFIKILSSNEGRLAIYLEYPVLIRRVWQMLEQWYAVSCEFIDRISSDYELLNQQFALDSSTIVALTGGAGDVHCQGRSVQVIEFANKKKLVYKPRPLAVDCAFRDLLRFLSKKGMKPDLRAPETIDRGDYGWCEYIIRKDCKTEAQVKKFYERQGAWLALFYVLGSCDLHLENLIASGEYPVVIDLETVFHPDLIERIIDSADELAMLKLFESVMSVGLLPNPIRAHGRSMDSSGIGAKPDQILPFDVDTVEDLHSDEIFVGTAPGRIGEIHSNPRLRGSNLEAVKYHRQIKDGFTSTYRILQELAGELLGEGGWFERFAKVPIRAVLRPTSYYGSLRLESLHPNFNRKSLDQDLIIRDFWSITRHTPVYENVISSERRQFLAGDIPYFSTTPESHDITGGDGTVIKSVLSRSGIEVVEDRFRRMSESELKTQLWYIDAALQSMSIANTPILQAKGYPRKCSDFLDAAIACGDHLVETALTHQNQSSWICLIDEGGSEEILYKLGIIKQSLYSGSLGIALFLAYLYAITGSKQYKEIAEGCLNQCHANYYSGLNSLGAYVGLCGLIYVNMHLAKLFDWADLHQRTSFALDLLPSYIASDQMLDLISGCAGAIPVLLAYSSYVPESRALGLARACGTKLLNYATPGSRPGTLQWTSLPMARGFSHGTSGIAFALSELAAATNEKEYFSAFISAVGHEAELFKGNHWTDIPGNPHGVAWCHGTAGIALSRLKIYERHKLPPAKEEALRALNFSLASPSMVEHVICHGSVGNLEPLLLAAELFPEEAIWERELQMRSQQIIKDLNNYGWRSKLPSQCTEPGLMIGIAGIGMQFLRLHARHKVPSILTLDKPL